MSTPNAQERQRSLIRTNIEWLSQALVLLAHIDDHAYARSPAGFAPHRVGGHLRHVLEFYECLFAGLIRGRVDYDARLRDLTVEQSRLAAMARLRAIIETLQTTPSLLMDAPLQVRMEDAAATGAAYPWVASSIGRELQVLSSHTIHHFALIAITLMAHGYAVPPNFGMAPSTLRHMENAGVAA